jgi:serine/threonine-protein kinase
VKVVEGDVLAGRYAIEQELGFGGMGVVFRGRDLRLGRPVAIKVLLTSAEPQSDAAVRFEREARVGAHINHAHLIGTYDFGRIGDTVYLVLQLVTEGDLRRYALRHHPVTIQRACLIAYQIADALAAAHGAGVVHRDLKPENVLLESSEPLHIRVADFGMAFLETPDDPKDGRMTRDGRMAGTPAYMAPEQIVDQQVGAPADVYALGCLLYELLAGVPPFQGSVVSLIAQHVYTPPPRLGEVRPDAPPVLDELVDRMLEKPPALRPTAEAVRIRLGHLVDGTELPPQRGADPVDRTRRMISRQADTLPLDLPAAPAVRVGIAGPISPELAAALGVAGFQEGAAPAVWLAIGRSTEEIATLVATGVPVVVTGRRDDFARVTEWLRLGVADVAFEPLAPAGVVQKLQKVVGRSAGGMR